MRQEKLLNIWNEYKNTIIASIIILIVTAAGTTTYKSWNQSRNETETSRLLAAMSQEEPKTALEELIQNTRSGHKTLAQMALASIYEKEKNTEAAHALYQNMAESRSTKQPFRDQARLLYIQGLPIEEKIEKVGTLKPILINDKSPWHWHARIEASSIEATQGNYDKALELLAPVEKTNTIPTSLKIRAKALYDVYTYDKAQNKDTNGE